MGRHLRDSSIENWSMQALSVAKGRHAHTRENVCGVWLTPALSCYIAFVRS